MTREGWTLRLGQITRRGLVLIGVIALYGCAPPKVPSPISSIETPGEIEEYKEPAVTLPQSYIVRQGDTLAEIALSHGLDYNDLALWNNIADANKINTGQELQLRPPENLPTVAQVRNQRVEIIPVTKSEQQAGAPATGAAQTVLIGGKKPIAQSQPVVVKTQPRAVQYPYSKKQLQNLRAAESGGDSKATKPTKPAKPTKVAVASEPKTPKPPVAVPQKTRQRFGVKWRWPASGKVIQSFNDQSKGILISGGHGDPVFAASDGEVVYVGTGVKGYGRLVIIKHANDYLSAYAHTSEIFVAEGEKITSGQRIAAFGSSGTDKTSLRFEIRKKGKPVNPKHFLPK